MISEMKDKEKNEKSENNSLLSNLRKTALDYFTFKDPW